MKANKVSSKILSLIVGAFLCVCGFFTSCKTIQYVPVETIKKEYIAKTDTCIIQDSIYYEITTKNDTITIYKDRWHSKYVYKNDTIIKIDSIPVIQVVKETKEVNRLTWFQNTQIRLFWVLSVIFVLYILYNVKKFL